MTNLIKSIMQFLGRLLKWEPVQDFTDLPYMPPTPPVEPVIPPVEAPKQPVVATLLWDTPQHCFHSVRVICDREGLDLKGKDIVCACIYQESRFNNKAVGKNKNSTDWGLVQVNDTKGWHIGKGLRFPSIQYVLDRPEEAVMWMAGVYRTTKALTPWASYTSGAYKQWLSPQSPMWELK